MWPCFQPSVDLSLALAPGDECEHLEYVFNDQVLGQGLLVLCVETVYLGILMIHYNTAVYIIYCLIDKIKE